MLEHDAWANREMLQAVRAAPDPAALGLLCHVLAAERLWHARLHGEPSPLAVWPEPSLDLCEAEAEAMPADWRRFLAGLDEDGLGREIAYVNSKGEPWRSAVGDVLTHVALHSAHHRGQIAAALRAGGAAPPYTDYIHCVRQGRL